MIQRKRMLQQASVFIKQNPGEAHLTAEELRDLADTNNGSALLSKVFRYAANITGTPSYWHKVRSDLKAIITQVGPPTFFFKFSAADMHQPELHALFDDHGDTTSETRRNNVIDNPHIVDYFLPNELTVFSTTGCTKLWMLFGTGIDMSTRVVVLFTAMVLQN